jgi:hypothetical protein
MEHLEISEAEPIRKTDRRWKKTWPQHLAASLGKVIYCSYLFRFYGSSSFVGPACHVFVSVDSETELRPKGILAPGF